MADHSEFFTYMAQRDDARDEGDDAGFNYWRGYIDAIADAEGLTDDLPTIEAAYGQMQAWASEAMDAASEYGRKVRDGEES